MWHDKDFDENGKIKAKHAHVVIYCPNKIDVKYIAQWFNVNESCVQIVKGKNAFFECIKYLTHEAPEQQALGKHLYGDDEINANFDFREEINKQKEIEEEKEAEIEKYGKVLNEKEKIRNKVLFEGLTIRQLCVENPLAYQKDYVTLDKFRTKYLAEYAKMPPVRINYYICGNGGIGKGLISRALARCLYPQLENDDDIFYTIGTKGVTFEGYDGQPVVIWDDKRATDLLNALNGRDNVFNVFDPHPQKIKQQIKYASTCLINQYNIINGIQPYKDFIDGLAGEYIDRNGVLHKPEDKSQAYRRIPFIIPLHEEDFDLLMNKGVFEGTREYDQYIMLNNIRCNMRRIAEICGQNAEMRKKVEQQTLRKITDKNDLLVSKMSSIQSMSDQDIIAYFADYGKTNDEASKDEQISLIPPKNNFLSVDEIFCKM